MTFNRQQRDTGMDPVSENVKAIDPELAAVLTGECGREQHKLIMIASENYASEAVREVQGSLLTNKYAEGYPGKRYYQGCEFADQAEALALSRVKEIYGCDHANVQPHAGSQANMAAYFALLKPGDTIMGMDLSAGGHLTHGTAINFSGIMYKAVSYGVNKKTEYIDFGEIRAKAQQARPRLIVAGASAYPRTLDFNAFREIADECGAYLLVDMAHIAGLVAARLHPTPIPTADVVTSTTHKTLRGPRGGLILCKGQYAEAIDKMVFPGLQGGPFMHSIAAKAIAFKEAQKPSFAAYQQQVMANARVLAEELKRLGYTLVTGGTDNHLLLINLVSKGLTGKQAALTLEQAGIVVNKNRVPFDEKSPLVTSGIRIGTPALTTRGMKELEMKRIAAWVHEVLSDCGNEKVIARVKGEVKELCGHYPLFSK
jgi:glycine hydroxymethyltransferase